VEKGEEEGGAQCMPDLSISAQHRADRKHRRDGEERHAKCAQNCSRPLLPPSPTPLTGHDVSTFSTPALRISAGEARSNAHGRPARAASARRESAWRLPPLCRLSFPLLRAASWTKDLEIL
jgi:hypothetical protein